MGAKLVPVLEGLSLITQQKQPTAVLLDLQKASGHIAQEDLVFLGLQDGSIPFFGAPCRESILELVEATGAEVLCTATFTLLVVDVFLEDIIHAQSLCQLQKIHMLMSCLILGIMRHRIPGSVPASRLTGRILTSAPADVKQMLRCVGHLGGSQT